MRRVSTSATGLAGRWSTAVLSLALSLTAAVVAVARADTEPTNTTAAVVEPIRSLKGLQPLLPDVGDYIDPGDPGALLAAQQLGKALFWDTQAGSDRNACASCHFHAGADIRTKNQINPGLLVTSRPNGRNRQPNELLTAADFPFHKLLDPADRDSKILSDTDDVTSSQGTFGGDFVSSKRSNTRNAGRFAPSASENCKLAYTPLDPQNPAIGSPFHANGSIYRKVEPRHTPSVLNAAFNMRQYWDGRANNQFNGVDPYGRRTYIQQTTDPAIDPDYVFGNPIANVTGLIAAYDTTPLSNAPAIVTLRQPLIENASLASQAVGPPFSDYEMVCLGKSFADLGRKLIPLTPLATQVVDVNDSLFSATAGLVKQAAIPGLNTTYSDLIQRAFRKKWWSAPGRYVIDPSTRWPKLQYAGGYSQIEHNFSLFWGLAIQAYEQLLISDDSPFDRYMNGDATAVSDAALRGKDIFTGKGNCSSCHSGPLLSSAAAVDTPARLKTPIDTLLMRDGNKAMFDKGFFNTGVRPTPEDLGLGAVDAYGFDLSYTRQYRWQLSFGANTSSAVDVFKVDRCGAPGQVRCLAIPSIPRDAVDGSFKTPILRNAGLTPPYFHTGGQSNLKDVVRFYNRGGDRRATANGDTTGRDQKTPMEEINQTNLASGIGEPNGSTRRGLGLSEKEMDDLVEFLLTLSDERVACHSDVFDHPELPLVMGARDKGSARSPVARDIIATLPATGKLGLKAVVGECFPNSGDLFGTLNKDDRRGMQATFQRILRRLDVTE